LDYCHADLYGLVCNSVHVMYQTNAGYTRYGKHPCLQNTANYQSIGFDEMKCNANNVNLADMGRYAFLFYLIDEVLGGYIAGRNPFTL
jgi:hypothetical protein